VPDNADADLRAGLNIAFVNSGAEPHRPAMPTDLNGRLRSLVSSPCEDSAPIGHDNSMQIENERSMERNGKRMIIVGLCQKSRRYR